MNKKIAIINQRYGLEVNGGSEYYTRLIAERLNRSYQVEVLTTQALDYDTWQNSYQEKEEYLNGVCVRRFPVRKKRNIKKFRIVNKITRMCGKFAPVLEKWWIKEQGPYCPELIQYIKKNRDKYEVFIFVTYLYYVTFKGIPEVRGKSILIPTAHDEPYIYFKSYKKVFEAAEAFIYLTEEEKNFIEKQFRKETAGKYSRVLGVGIELPDELKNGGEKKEWAVQKWKKDVKITEPYFIYAGRVDYGKNCDELFRYFIRYKEEQKQQNQKQQNQKQQKQQKQQEQKQQKLKQQKQECRMKSVQDDCKLTVIGKALMPVPVHPDIVSLGYVEESAKYAAIASARALILPSNYESLSISVLEALALGVPVIVNGSCEVLKGHCEKSGAGIPYYDYDSFEAACRFMEQDSEPYLEMKRSGRQYVEENYRWELIEQGLADAIERVIEKNGADERIICLPGNDIQPRPEGFERKI